MYRSSVVVHSSNLLSILTLAICLTGHAQGQNSISVAQPRHSVSVLDSTKEQDGLVGSVRRVKTESARVELKEGRLIEGPPQLLELTTYGMKGNRIENISYPVADAQVGKEEYKYDGRGNITEMTLRDDHGSIVNRESYSYEFDNIGNWTKMITSLVLFENGRLKKEPVENTYRTITYYFTDDVAKIVDSPAPARSPSLPRTELSPTDLDAAQLDVKFTARDQVAPNSVSAGEPPALLVARPDTANAGQVEPKTTSESASNTKSQLSDRGRESTETGNRSRLLSLKRAPEPETTDKPAEDSVKKEASSVNASVENLPVTTAPAEESPQKVAFELYEKGLAYLEKGDIKNAIGAFVISVKNLPSAEVYLNLGTAYLKLEKNNDAAKAFQQSVKLDSDVAEAQYGLGLASFRLKRFPDARQAFKKAIALDPNMAKAHYGLGLTCLELGQTDVQTVEVRILENLDKQLARQLAAASPQRSLSCRFSVCQ